MRFSKSQYKYGQSPRAVCVVMCVSYISHDIRFFDHQDTRHKLVHIRNFHLFFTVCARTKYMHIYIYILYTQRERERRHVRHEHVRQFQLNCYAKRRKKKKENWERKFKSALVISWWCVNVNGVFSRCFGHLRLFFKIRLYLRKIRKTDMCSRVDQLPTLSFCVYFQFTRLYVYLYIYVTRETKPSAVKTTTVSKFKIFIIDRLVFMRALVRAHALTHENAIHKLSSI